VQWWGDGYRFTGVIIPFVLLTVWNFKCWTIYFSKTFFYLTSCLLIHKMYDIFIFYTNSHFLFQHKLGIISLFYVTICISDFYTILDIFYTVSVWSYCLYVFSISYFRCSSCVLYLHFWQFLHLSKCIPLCEYGSDLLDE